MPFLAALPAIAGVLGGIFGGAGKASSDSRAQQNLLNAQRDQTDVQKYGVGQNAQMAQGNLDLERKGFSEDARGNRAKQALLADLLMGFQPQRVTVPGVASASISGGPSIGEGGKAGLAEMQKQALAAMLAGDKFEGGNILKAPGATPIQQAGTLEKILGIGGLIGSGIGGIGGALQGFGGGQSYIPQQAGGLPEGLNPDLFKHLFTGN